METRMWREMLVPYYAAVDELKMKFKHIIRECRDTGVYSPIEQVEGRVKRIPSILEKAQITNLRIHDLRHTLATYLIANGADAFIVQRALTHKSLQSTQVYVNLGVEHLRDKLNDTVNKMLNIGKK